MSGCGILATSNLFLLEEDHDIVKSSVVLLWKELPCQCCWTIFRYYNHFKLEIANKCFAYRSDEMQVMYERQAHTSRKIQLIISWCKTETESEESIDAGIFYNNCTNNKNNQ